MVLVFLVRAISAGVGLLNLSNRDTTVELLDTVSLAPSMSDLITLSCSVVSVAQDVLAPLILAVGLHVVSADCRVKGQIMLQNFPIIPNLCLLPGSAYYSSYIPRTPSYWF